MSETPRSPEVKGPEEQKQSGRAWSEDMDEISGFGGGYEEGCRRMVLAGLAWLEENPGPVPAFTIYKNLVGMITEMDERAKAMTKAMLEAAGTNGATGAMVQFTVSHALKAHEVGWPAYVDLMRARKAKGAYA